MFDLWKTIVYVVSTIFGFIAASVKAACMIPLWGWFITPLVGVAAPGFWALVGLFYITALFHPVHIREEDVKADFDDAAKRGFLAVIVSIWRSLTVLGIGWLVHFAL